MNLRFAVIILLVSLLTACAKPQPEPRLDQPSASLAEASYAVSRSLADLSEVAQAASPAPSSVPMPSPEAYGMSGLTTVNWSGPVEPIVRQIAKSTGYKLRVLGKPPAIPVLVSVYDRNMPIADILRDVGFQCGRRATVVVYPQTNIVELRYARN